MRDSQRSRVYKSERGVLRVHPLKRFKTFDEVWDYTQRVLGSKWVQRTWGYKSNCTIKYNPRLSVGKARAIGYFNIEFGRDSFTTRTALHEIAHHLAIRRDGSHNHGRTFTRFYLKLLQHFEGAHVARETREQFRRNGVKYRKPPKITRARREQLQERGRQLAAARAASKQQS